MTLNSLLLEKLIPRYLVGIFRTYSLLLSIVNCSSFSFVKFNTLLFNPVCILIMMSESSPEYSPGKAASHQMSVPMPSPQEAAMNAALSWYYRGKWEGQWRAVSSPSFWKLSQGYCSARLTLAGRVARQDFLGRETSFVPFTSPCTLRLSSKSCLTFLKPSLLQEFQQPPTHQKKTKKSWGKQNKIMGK